MPVQPGQNLPAHVSRFIGQDRHFSAAEFFQGVGYSGICDSIIEQVMAVILNEKLSAPLTRVSRRVLSSERRIKASTPWPRR